MVLGPAPRCRIPINPVSTVAEQDQCSRSTAKVCRVWWSDEYDVSNGGFDHDLGLLARALHRVIVKTLLQQIIQRALL